MTAAIERIVGAPGLLPSGGIVLDYGCGEMPYRPLFAQRYSSYVGADLRSNRRADLILGADGEIPLDSGEVDCVLSTQVLEHVPDPHAYLLEAHRVLGDDGRLLLSTHGHWEYHPTPTDFWRWTRPGLELELRRAGFETVHVVSVLGKTAAALQLLQAALADALPGRGGALARCAIQPLIGLVERRRREVSGVSNDAAVYLVVAAKAGRWGEAGGP